MRVVLLLLCLLLLVVPVMADDLTLDGSYVVVDPTAAPTDGDSVIKGLLSGWGGTTAPTYYTSSWFWEVLESVRSSNKLQNDLVSGWGYSATTNIFSNPSGYNSSWYSSVLKGFSLISSDTDGIFDSILDIQVDVGYIEGYSLLIKSYVESIDSSVGFIESDVNDINSNVNSIESLISLYLPNLQSIKLNTDSLITKIISLDQTTQSIDSTTKSIDTTTKSLYSNFTDYVDLWTSDNVTNSNSNSGFGLLTRLRDVLASDIDLEISNASEDDKATYVDNFGAFETGDFQFELFSVFSNFIDNDVYVDDLREFFPRLLWNLGNFFTEDTYSQIQDQGVAAVAFSLGPEDESSDTPYLDAANEYVSSIIGR